MASHPEPSTYGVERLAALSDGVFAIVVTLLVLDLRLPEPHPKHEELLQSLSDNLPDFAGWLVSFVVVARFWTVHHHVVAQMERARTSTVILNFTFLGTISLVPFAASLVGTYAFREPIALVVFSAVFGLAAMTLGVFTLHAARQGLLRGGTTALGSGWRHHGVVVPLVAIAAGALAFVNPELTLALLLAEGIYAIALRVRGRRGTFFIDSRKEPTEGVHAD